MSVTLHPLITVEEENVRQLLAKSSTELTRAREGMVSLTIRAILYLPYYVAAAASCDTDSQCDTDEQVLTEGIVWSFSPWHSTLISLFNIPSLSI